MFLNAPAFAFEGTWTDVNSGKDQFTQSVVIRSSTPNHFQFDITHTIGVYSGEIRGDATIIGGKAYFSDASSTPASSNGKHPNPYGVCKLTFEIKNKQLIISSGDSVESSDRKSGDPIEPCMYYTSQGFLTNFDGTFVKESSKVDF